MSPRSRRVKRGLLTKAEPKVVIQHLAVDEFAEVPERKRTAERAARGLGHALSAWHRRPNDPAGRWNAFCHDCNRLAVVATEPVEKLGDVYGRALTEQCGRVCCPHCSGELMSPNVVNVAECSRCGLNVDLSEYGGKP